MGSNTISPALIDTDRMVNDLLPDRMKGLSGWSRTWADDTPDPARTRFKKGVVETGHAVSELRIKVPVKEHEI